MSEHGFTLWGRTYIACGSAPAIYGCKSYLHPFVESATDAEFRAFVSAILNGAEPQRKQSVDALTAKLYPNASN